jgi:hypothetical protein
MSDNKASWVQTAKSEWKRCLFIYNMRFSDDSSKKEPKFSMESYQTPFSEFDPKSWKNDKPISGKSEMEGVIRMGVPFETRPGSF